MSVRAAEFAILRMGAAALVVTALAFSAIQGVGRVGSLFRVGDVLLKREAERHRPEKDSRPLSLPSVDEKDVVYSAIPDEPDLAKSRDAEELRKTERLIQAELPRWKVEMGTDAAKLKLDPKPLLRWTNPASGRMHGEIYVWTANGRPETIMSLYKVWEPAWGFAGELQSLSLTNLVAERDQAVAWKCATPGITLHDVPDAPAIAETARRRLQQMHAIANDFSAELMDSRQNVKGERQVLRLLTQPVYRYSSHGGDVMDGAMFAFVIGTDVEVLLLLEARETKNGNRWQYALARLNRDELVAFFKEQEVWRVGRATYEERDKPYVFMSLSEPPLQD